MSAAYKLQELQRSPGDRLALIEANGGNFEKLLFGIIDNKNFNNELFLPKLASSLFDNAVKMLCAQVQARALPEKY